MWWCNKGMNNLFFFAVIEILFQAVIILDIRELTVKHTLLTFNILGGARDEWMAYQLRWYDCLG